MARRAVVFDMDALERMAAANAAVPAVLRRNMTTAAQRIIVPAVEQEMRRANAPGQSKRLIIPGSFAGAGFAGYDATAGVSNERLSGGAVASQLARAWEFGTLSPDAMKQVPRRNLRVGSFYSRRTQKQVPRRSTKGWVFYPAMGRVAKRAVPLYVQLAVRVLADALEGKST